MFPSGHTLEFADQSGMNAFGHIMLGTMDVHHQWTKVGANLFAIDVIWISLAFLIHPPPVLIQLFEQVYGFSSLLQQTEWMKERIRFMLGGAEVILSERFGSAQGITEHYTALSVFHQNILSQCLRLHPRSLQGLSLLLEKYAVKLQFLNTQLFVLACSFDQSYLMCLPSDPTEPSLHEMGHFIIPISFELSMLQFFLKSNAVEARRRTQHRNQ